MDRLEAMRAFVAVARHGSFTAAANYLDLSPQLVSKYVSQLEHHLGSRLLNRTTRRVHLTEAGQRYQQRAQQVLSEIEDMENQLGDMQTQVRGLLRISAPVSFATGHLAPLLSQFQQAHPQLGVELQLNDRKVDIIEEGFDVALRIGQLKNSSLIAKRLAPVRLIMCAAPSYLRQYGSPDSLKALREHRYLRYSYVDEAASPKAHQWLTMMSSDGAGEVICNNGDVLLQRAIAGDGIVIQPSFLCGPALARGELSELLPEFEPPPLGLYAIYAHRQMLASKVRRFIDFVDGFFGDPPYWDKATGSSEQN